MERKALSSSNVLFGMRADIQRDYRKVVFLEVVVQWLDAASTARQHARVHSRHPGRNPKLASKTSPAFEREKGTGVVPSFRTMDDFDMRRPNFFFHHDMIESRCHRIFGVFAVDVFGC